MEFVSFVGQTLDDKYKIEREIGRGGMGTVYLATHVGTERPVALKIIAPQFMEKAEFVERFRREARAAGRLRHPNVVDVTDFGFAESKQGNVAYLVMEYLDGVTLGEVLEEEKKLPLLWTLDILEQVCSAVQEAHAQGIIHRDLKPDNIWLEPNQRGGYTVKVLDFGIAKLENLSDEIGETSEIAAPTLPTKQFGQTTIGDALQADTIIENKSSTFVSEAGTILQTDQFSPLNTQAGTILQSNGLNLEDKTAIFDSNENKTVSIEENFRTKPDSAQIETGKSLINSPATANLTRVGAVLGTPLYMSPEQCRGERLGQSSDIYSLAVIAYQMLSGETPFTGDFKTVMQAHKEVETPKLDVKKVPKKVRETIFSALAKDAQKRPPTAQAFASKLRAGSEGIGELLRKSLVIYSEHLPKFLFVSFLTAIPGIVLSLVRGTFNLLRAFGFVEESIWAKIFSGTLGIATFFVQIFFAAFLIGITTWIVAQILAMPLRPINLQAAFKKLKSRWKPLAGTVTVSTLLSMLGWLFCLLPGIWLSARYMLIGPAIMMEGASGKAAFRRSVELVKRSYRTVLATVLLVYIVPGALAFLIAISIGGIVKSFDIGNDGKQEVETGIRNDEDKDFNITFNRNKVFVENDGNVPVDKENRMARQLRESLSNGLFELLWSPIIILITSFTSVITALLYFKTRLAGGESMLDLLEQFEESDRPKSNWQKRVRERLVQSGRITSRSS